MGICSSRRHGLTLIFIGAVMTGLASAQTKSPELTGDLAFGRSIALIRGHLLEGEELVKLREWNTAYPHFTFPTEEIYGVIRDELPNYRTPQFDHALKTLAHTVRIQSVHQYPKALAKVEVALGAADAGLKARQSDWPQFTMMVAVAVLKTAAEEYDNAIENGRIGHAVGYRTVRGFVLQADRMLESAMEALPAADTAVVAAIRSDMTTIKSAFAGQTAPDRPTIDTKGFDEAVLRIESSSQKLAAGRQI